MAAGAVYGLEGALSDLEDCARSISSDTTETELAFLEDQVANAAAQVQQSELQVCVCVGTMLNFRDNHKLLKDILKSNLTFSPCQLMNCMQIISINH